MPTPIAACLIAGSMPRMPVMVFRTTGSML